MHYLIINSRFGSKLLPARLPQEFRQREAANTSWHGPVWASAPLGFLHIPVNIGDAPKVV